jgi:hypothetical protein
MDITMIGLQNAGKTSLLRVLAVSACFLRTRLCVFDCGHLILTIALGRRVHYRVCY